MNAIFEFRAFCCTSCTKLIFQRIIWFVKKIDLARNPDLGHKAIAQLKEELTPEEFSKIRFHQLDITDEASAIKFRDHLQKEHGGIDILINNAGTLRN